MIRQRLTIRKDMMMHRRLTAGKNIPERMFRYLMSREEQSTVRNTAVQTQPAVRHSRALWRTMPMTEPDRQMHRIHMAAEMRPTDGTALMKNRKSPGKKKAALERKL